MPRSAFLPLANAGRRVGEGGGEAARSSAFLYASYAASASESCRRRFGKKRARRRTTRASGVHPHLVEARGREWRSSAARDTGSRTGHAYAPTRQGLPPLKRRRALPASGWKTRNGGRPLHPGPVCKSETRRREPQRLPRKVYAHLIIARPLPPKITGRERVADHLVHSRKLGASKMYGSPLRHSGRAPQPLPSGFFATVHGALLSQPVASGGNRMDGSSIGSDRNSGVRPERDLSFRKLAALAASAASGGRRPLPMQCRRASGSSSARAHGAAQKRPAHRSSGVP
jgi:hypothetical protein